MFQRKDEQLFQHGEAMSPEEFERLVERSPDIRYEYMQGRVYALAGGDGQP